MSTLLNIVTDIKTVSDTVTTWAKKVYHGVKTLPASAKADYTWVVTNLTNLPKRLGEGTTTGTHTPAPTTATKTEKKTEAATKAKTKKTLATQNTYQKDILSLLEPYSHAVSDLPQEFHDYLGALRNAPSGDTPAADEIANQLAAQYGQHVGGAMTANLSKAENKALTTAFGTPGTRTPMYSALTELAKGMSLYAKEVPYEDINKALLGRIQYETTYGTHPLQLGKGWPGYLRTVYNAAVANSAAAGSGTSLTVPGLSTVTKQTTSSTATAQTKKGP